MRSGSKIVKTIMCLKKMDVPLSWSKGERLGHDLQNIPKTGFFHGYLIPGFLQFQNDIDYKHFQ